MRAPLEERAQVRHNVQLVHWFGSQAQLASGAAANCRPLNSIADLEFAMQATSLNHLTTTQVWIWLESSVLRCAICSRETS
jgi:hypothetical protein